MTLVVGYTDNNTVYMAADNSINWDNQFLMTTHSKILSLSINSKNPIQFLVGFSGSFRMGQLLEHSFNIPSIEDTPVYKYMCIYFVPALIKLFEANRFLYEQNNTISGGTLLIGIKGSLFLVQEDFSVIETTNKYAAIGCGETYALGAFNALEYISTSISVESRIKAALTAAATFSPYVSVSNPITIYNT